MPSSPPTTSTSFSLLLIILCFACVSFPRAATPTRDRGEASSLQATSTSMDTTERETLFQLLEAVSSDRDWRVTNPDPCSPGSSWPGIECSAGKDGIPHVARLDFGTPLNPTCNDAATFPPQLFHLPYLQSAFFFACFRTKTTTLAAAAPYMANATALQQLGLKSNPALTGTIPPEISSMRSLEVLTLSQNHLQGAIPEAISSLTSLEHLDLSYNHLTGSIPIRVGSLRNLLGLDLSYNQLTGPIPTSLGHMGALQKLDLSSNALTGGIPESMENLGSLSFLALSNNKLRGPFPGGLPKMGNLQYFLMDDNPMAVELPQQLGRLARLQELRLADSGYWGPIPDSFSRLANLTTLALQNNRLSGGIPTGLGGLRRMYHLNLSRNMLGGVVPFDQGFLRRLGGNLDLSGNPGLCMNRSEGLEGVKVGVGVCDDHHHHDGDGNSNREASVGRSHGVSSVPVSLHGLLVGFLGTWGFCSSLF
uniref:Protein TOO MANY MOUTHS n=1 Tax=Anthurium amnicola TaxID=1678845 RepID=A0A1D1Y6Z7_9ARAE